VLLCLGVNYVYVCLCFQRWSNSTGRVVVVTSSSICCCCSVEACTTTLAYSCSSNSHWFISTQQCYHYYSRVCSSHSSCSSSFLSVRWNRRNQRRGVRYLLTHSLCGSTSRDGSSTVHSSVEMVSTRCCRGSGGRWYLYWNHLRSSTSWWHSCPWTEWNRSIQLISSPLQFFSRGWPNFVFDAKKHVFLFFDLLFFWPKKQYIFSVYYIFWYKYGSRLQIEGL